MPHASGRRTEVLKTHPRPHSWLPLAGLLVLAVLGLGGLLLGLAGDRKGMQALPDTADSTVEVLPDLVASHTLAQVVAQPASAWRSWEGGDYIQAFYGEAVWVRVTLRNPGERAVRGMLADAEYYTDRIDCWVQEDGAGAEAWSHAEAGEAVPAERKARWGRDAAFAIDVPAGGTRTVYLRAQDHFGVWLRLGWWPDERRFHAAQLRDAVAEAAYFGILLALFVYNGVLWARLRFEDTGFYLLYLASIGVFMAFSRSQHQVIGLAVGSPWMETILMVALGLSGFFLAQFARAFLELPTRTPAADRVARVTGLCGAGLAVGALAMPWMNNTLWLHFMVGGIVVINTVLLGVGLWAWRRGAAHARYFVLSFGVLFSGALPTATIWLLAIPLGISAMSFVMSSALEMMLLSLAIADRFVRMQRDQLAAQARAAAEAEQRRTMQEAYADELEVEVRERTRELAVANADKDRMLTVLGHDLRSPLSALTYSAEQLRHASRSPLPPAADAVEAGAEALQRFAGEVAGAGRQLLLLIEDIVVWTRLRAGSAPLESEHPVAVLVEAAAGLHGPLAARRNVTLVADVPEALRVCTDLVLAQTLLRNLVGNAVKFATTRVEVVASPVAGGRGVRLCVRDDGPGLPPAIVARLGGGEPDSQAAALASGGLGLRLCQEIAGSLGVRLEARPRADGCGTELSVELPAVAGAGTRAAVGLRSPGVGGRP